MRAMLLAAGLGTRLKPFTDHHPKALAIVGGKTLLQRNVEYLIGNGVTDIIINVHHFSDQIIAALSGYNNFGINIQVSDESEEVLETGGGLLKARGFFKDNSPFILMNVDILTDLNIRSMILQHISSKSLATLAVTNRKTSRYLLFDSDRQLCGWKNVKTGEQKISRESTDVEALAFSGIHIISPEIFPMVSLSGKFSMIELYLALAKTESIHAYDHTGSKFMDVGTPASIQEAAKVFE